MDLFYVDNHLRDADSPGRSLRARHRLSLLQRFPGRQGGGARRSANARRPTSSTTARTIIRPTSGFSSAITSRPSRAPGRSSARCWRSSTATCPGLLWLVIGVCLAGAVQDMLVLAASVRRGGKSLAEIARTELGKPGVDHRLSGDPVHRRHRAGRPRRSSSSRRSAAKR